MSKVTYICNGCNQTVTISWKGVKTWWPDDNKGYCAITRKREVMELHPPSAQ